MAVAERIEVADAPERHRYELSIDGEAGGRSRTSSGGTAVLSVRQAFIERHPEFAALVPENYREQFGL